MNLKNYILRCFPAFKHKNFSLFWTGQAVSFIGTWLQNAALSWLVYSITADKFKLGLMSAVQFTPLLLFSLPAGIFIEMHPKRKIIMVTQSLQLLSAMVLFLMIVFDKIQYGYILIILFILGSAQAVDNPARQSFIVELVEGRDDLLNAIALNSAAFNSARLIGPAIAGKLMASFGEKWCFFLNAVSFLAVLLGLFMMKIEDKSTRKEHNLSLVEGVKKSFGEIIEGLKYIVKTPKLLYTLISTAIIPTFCMNFTVLMPILTRDTFNLEEEAYGTLLSALGLGALISAIAVAVKGRKKGPLKLQMTGALGLGIFLLILGFNYNYIASLFLLIACGFFMIMFSTTSNSIIQMNSPDDMRGRIMSVYSLLFGGLVPVGSLYAGTLSKFFGVNNALIISGIIGLLGFTFLFCKRRELK